MRDQRADRDYFDALASRNLEGLETGRKDAADPAVQQDNELYANLTHLYRKCAFTLVDAAYSSGEASPIVLQRVPELVNAEVIYRQAQSSTQHGPFTFDQHQAQYTVSLRILSLAVLTGLPQSTINNLVDATGCHGMDLVYDFLSDSHDADRITDTVAWPKPYGRLADVIVASSDKQSRLMESFLKYWYNQSRQAPWWGSHLKVGKKNFTYSGYWCYEAAAVTKLLGIDDSSYRDNEYYPKELLSNSEG